MTTITTLDETGAILAKYIFQDFDLATEWLANCDIEQGNISDEPVQRIVIDIE